MTRDAGWGETPGLAPGRGESRLPGRRAGMTDRREYTASGRRRRSPPYGRRLKALLADRGAWPKYSGTSPDGQHLTIRVVAGSDAWRIAHAWRPLRPPVPFVLAPPGEDPAGFDWRVLAGDYCPLTMLWIAGKLPLGDERALVIAILRAGAEGVLVIAPDRRQLYRRAERGEVAHG